MKNKRIKIALLCASGGHFEQMFNLTDFYTKYERFWITMENMQTKSALEKEKKYFIKPGHFKKPWTYIAHLPEIVKILRSEKPTHIISTGSGRIAFIPFLLSKLLKIKFIYIETYSRVNNLTLLANFLLKAGHPVLTQWENNKQSTICIGPVFKSTVLSDSGATTPDDYIFVTVGTRTESFARLLKYLDNLVEKEVVKNKVIVQAGYTKYDSQHLEVFDFCPVTKIDELIQNAKFIITQESAGITTKCLRYNRRFIVIPRDYVYGELPAKSDMQEDLQYRLEELGYTYVVNNEEDLAKSIKNIDKLKTGFVFDNKQAILKLTELVES